MLIGENSLIWLQEEKIYITAFPSKLVTLILGDTSLHSYIHWVLGYIHNFFLRKMGVKVLQHIVRISIRVSNHTNAYGTSTEEFRSRYLER